MNCPPLLFLCANPAAGDAHWRMTRPRARLAEAGVDAQICWLGSDMQPTLPVAGCIVVLQRVIVTGGEAEAHAWVDGLRAAGALAVVFELDDDELSGAQIEHLAATHPLSEADRIALRDQQQRLRWTLAACDGATVSTDPLAEVVRRYTCKPVITVPNAIDVDWFRNRLVRPAPGRSGALTIGWAGWSRPDADLESMAEAWARIARHYPHVRFVVAGHQPDVIYRQDIPLDRIIRRPIAPLDEYPPLHQVDIGCCAVADSPFSRCKTPIKAWEYVLAGAAVVGTNLLYGACLDDGFRGMVAETDGVETADDWERCLSEFVESAESRRQLGRNLWRHVEAEHTLVGNLHRWTDAYKQIVEARAGVPA